MKKASLAKGTRDFLPLQAKRRKYIFDTIERHFQSFGYQPLETPAMENLDTLLGKYGDEGDKLLFKILNSGDFMGGLENDTLSQTDSGALALKICEKGLRYDLTVPFARVVAMNQHAIGFPFKRYQIQPVWRADRPQRGRYREFYQCDADVVGSTSLMYEAELIQLYDQVFNALGIPVTIHLNHRKILEGMAVQLGIGEQFMAMTVEIDKLDKSGPEALEASLGKLGILPDQCQWLLQQLKEEKTENFRYNEISEKGVNEINQVMGFNQNYPMCNKLVFDPSLARGLSYYTGCIFEVKPCNVQMGSLGGGGRYDELTAVFGLKGISGVGISFGADRIYDVLTEQNGFPGRLGHDLKALFLVLEEASLGYAFQLAGQLRRSGIPVDVYPEAHKLKKQFQHAERLEVPYVVIVGSQEMQDGTVTLKNQLNGDQKVLTAHELADYLVKHS